jgi:hypothetical protein
VRSATAALALLTTGLATQEAIGATSADGQRHPANTPLSGDEAYERDRAQVRRLERQATRGANVYWRLDTP